MPGRADFIGSATNGRQAIRALCSVSPADDGVASTRIQLMPAGPVVVARDDRMFDVRDVATAAQNSELPMLIDWEHNSESYYGSTRAAGWIQTLEVDPDGSLWGTVKWSKEGQADVESGAYAFLSPVLMIDGETRAVTSLVSAALTNKPALKMTQVSKFREQFNARHVLQLSAEQEGSTMDSQTRKALCATLKLAEGASDAEIAAAVSRAQGATELLSQQTTEASALKAERDALRARAERAEADAASVAFDKKVGEMFEANKNKITPAVAKGLREQFAEQPGTFDAFVKYQLPHMPVIGEAAPSSVNDPASREQFSGKQPPALDDEVKRAAARVGITGDRLTAVEAYRVHMQTRDLGQELAK